MSEIKEYNEFRSKMNERLLGSANTALKRFFSLDNQTYQDGVLDAKTKEMLGLVASMVLRCDDCIKYHIGQCKELGMTEAELFEIFMVANMVGGSICIPHTRRAIAYWDALVDEIG